MIASRQFRQTALRLASVAALLTVPAMLTGCSSGPVATIRNNAEIPLSVTFWTSERVGGYANTWADMAGQADRVGPGKRQAFRLDAYRKAADPVLRMQVVTRGPSWEPVYNYWFEVVTSPPLTITLEGSPDRLAATPGRGLVQPIPWARVPDERRRVDQPAQAQEPPSSGSRQR